MAEVGLREYVERIIEERHALYQTQFDALEAHIERSLAALIEGKKEAYSKTYLILSGGSMLVALIALVMALWRR
jgi:hypothetical protein